MIGDSFEARIHWHEWLGGRDGVGRLRTCEGTIEHVAVGWVLIRRPRGGLLLKRLSRRIADNGRLAAWNDSVGNVLAVWLDEDSDARPARGGRIAAAKVRRESDREAAAWQQPEAAPADDLPF